MCITVVIALQSNSTPFETFYDDECSLYTGICSIHLNELTAGDNDTTTLSSIVITEQQLSEFFSLLESFSAIISEECSAAVLPFLCQYVHPPCDGNGSAQFITQEQCINIRDDVCKIEWRIAMTTEQGNLLPVCETLNTSSVTTVNDTEPLKCHYQFKEFCGVCLPLCGTFSTYSDQSIAVSLAGGVLVGISGFIFIVIAVIRPSQI